ncbi:MAG: hypothetical protein V4677_15585 [Bacteroidota bacterium]
MDDLSDNKMLRLLLFTTMFPILSFGQSTFSLNKDEQSKVFCQAIAEYIKAAYKNDKSTFDTLFIGQYDDHRDKKLLTTIQKTGIVLLTNEKEGVEKLKYRKSFGFVNIAELKVTQDSAMYAFVTFFVDKSNEKVNWWPKHNCFINFNYDAKRKEFKLDKVKFEYQYSNKYSKKP